MNMAAIDYWGLVSNPTFFCSVPAMDGASGNFLTTQALAQNPLSDCGNVFINGVIPASSGIYYSLSNGAQYLAGKGFYYGPECNCITYNAKITDFWLPLYSSGVSTIGDFPIYFGDFPTANINTIYQTPQSYFGISGALSSFHLLNATTNAVDDFTGAIGSGVNNTNPVNSSYWIAIATINPILYSSGIMTINEGFNVLNSIQWISSCSKSNFPPPSGWNLFYSPPGYLSVPKLELSCVDNIDNYGFLPCQPPTGNLCLSIPEIDFSIQLNYQGPQWSSFPSLTSSGVAPYIYTWYGSFISAITAVNPLASCSGTSSSAKITYNYINNFSLGGIDIHCINTSQALSYTFLDNNTNDNFNNSNLPAYLPIKLATCWSNDTVHFPEQEFLFDGNIVLSQGDCTNSIGSFIGCSSGITTARNCTLCGECSSAFLAEFTFIPDPSGWNGEYIMLMSNSTCSDYGLYDANFNVDISCNGDSTFNIALSSAYGGGNNNFQGGSMGCPIGPSGTFITTNGISFIYNLI